MNTLVVEQIIGPLLPLYFLVRYLIRVRPQHRMIESWWLLGSNAAFFLLLMLGEATALFGQNWPGRQGVRIASYFVTITVFAAEIAWLEYRLRRGTAQIPPDGPEAAPIEPTTREAS